MPRPHSGKLRWPELGVVSSMRRGARSVGKAQWNELQPSLLGFPCLSPLRAPPDPGLAPAPISSSSSGSDLRAGGGGPASATARTRRPGPLQTRVLADILVLCSAWRALCGHHSSWSRAGHSPAFPGEDTDRGSLYGVGAHSMAAEKPRLLLLCTEPQEGCRPKGGRWGLQSASRGLSARSAEGRVRLRSSPAARQSESTPSCLFLQP